MTEDERASMRPREATRGNRLGGLIGGALTGSLQ